MEDQAHKLLVEVQKLRIREETGQTPTAAALAGVRLLASGIQSATYRARREEPEETEA